MKKLLAILLTLIFTFSCFSVLGNSTVLAEETAVNYGEELINNGDFKNGATGWAGKNAGSGTTVSADETEPYLHLVPTASKTTQLHTSLDSRVAVKENSKYEFSFYIRVPQGGFGENSYPIFSIYETGLNGTDSDARQASKNDYANAYDAGYGAYRTDFKSVWTVEGYEPVTRNKYSFIDSGLFEAIGKTPNEAFANWTKVTCVFETVADEANGLSAAADISVAFTYSSKNNNGIMDIKKVSLREILEKSADSGVADKTLIKSDFGDGTKWTLRGAASFTDENKDGVNDYARLTCSSSAQTALKSTPAEVVAGRDYELSFYARIPEGSKAFQTESYNYYPEFAMYKPTLNADGTQVTDNYSTGTNDYAYKKDAFVSTWQIGDFTPIERNRFSFFSSDLYATACPDTTIDEAFNGWTKVTYKFTGIALSDNASETVAFYFSLPKDKTGAAVDCIFDIKDVTLVEKGTGTPETPENPNAPEDAVYYEDFENVTDPTSVVTVYSNDQVNHKNYPAEIVTDASSGTKAYSAHAMYQQIFIPFDKAKLQAGTVYSFSIDWKLLEYNDTDKHRIEEFYFVGYTPEDGVMFKNGLKALAGKAELKGTGNWENLTFDFKLSEYNYNKYQQFGIYICYKLKTPYDNPEDNLFLDNILVKPSENQGVANPLKLNEDPRTEDTIKVLAFGNSFSNDGTSFIPQIANADGTDLRVADASIGGCSLATHYQNSVTNDPAYTFAYRTPHAQNTYSKRLGGVTMEQALTATDYWDYIVIQQVSTMSGRPDTFEPYLEDLIAKFKEYCPTAKIVFQMTWAYKDGIEKSGYEAYDNDQLTMYNAILETYEFYAEKYDAEFVIPSGVTIQKLREVKQQNPELFATENDPTEEEIAAGTNADKGDFTRDGYHLADKGRIAAAFTWYEMFTGISAEDTKIDLTTSAYGTLDATTGKQVEFSAEEAAAVKKAAHEAAMLYKKAEVSNIPGDINGSGTQPDVEDVTLLAQYFAGWDVADSVNEAVLDVNGDDAVNLYDLVLLAQYVAGWDVEIKGVYK